MEAAMGEKKMLRSDRELELHRLRLMQQETTDPLAARLLADIVAELELELKAAAAARGDTSN